MLDGLHGEVNVQVRPVQVAWGQKPELEQLPDRRQREPREMPEGQEQLFAMKEEPETLPRDVGHFNGRSAPSTPNGFHLRAPGSDEALP